MKSNKQLCNVVMLPTNEASRIFKVESIHEMSLNPMKVGSLSLEGEPFTNDRRTIYQPQHLYITVNRREDDESTWIKEGDWYLSLATKTCGQREKGMADGYDKTVFFKIIATTDKSLKTGDKELVAVEFGTDYQEYQDKYLPQIPEAFIKKFVENQGNITEVLVEYEELSPMQQMLVKESYVPENTFDIKPKLRSDNTIIISPSKTYTREEVKQILYKYSNFLCELNTPPELQDGTTSWIEENL